MRVRASRELHNPREVVNGLTHLGGALLSAVGLALLARTPAAQLSTGHAVALWVFGISLILLYASSTVHHLAQVPPRQFELLRRVDHVMIYVLIAGTYTPVCAVLIGGRTGTVALIVVWTVAVAGTLQKIAWMHAPRWLSTALYLVMGWAGAVAGPMLLTAAPTGFFAWVLAGGVWYSGGAVIYNLKRPNPFPGRLGSHEIWHLCVLAGSACHFWAIYRYVAHPALPG